MMIQQHFSLRVMPKWKKSDIKGTAPLYVFIRVDGQEEELSLACKTAQADWDSHAKRVLPTHPDAVAVNKKIVRALVDLDRHFDGLQALHGRTTAAQVKAAYMGPAAETKVIDPVQQRVLNLQLDEQLTSLINRFLDFCKKEHQQRNSNDGPTEEMHILLHHQKECFKKEITEVLQAAQKLFDDPNHTKTVILAVNDYFLHFLQQVITGHKAFTTLEKNMCRKRRFVEFFKWRCRKEDLPLTEIKGGFPEEFKNYNAMQFGVGDPTATKTVQFLKEMVKRALAKGWIASSEFVLYKCKYKETTAAWPSYEDMMVFKDFDFEDATLNETRDVAVFQSFTGLGYNELYYLRIRDIVVIDGKKWISKTRRKSKNEEPVPLLPIALEILERYVNHSVRLRSGRLLPVPSNQEYNDRLKILPDKAGIAGEPWTTHKMRYFFANEVTFNNGVHLRIIQKMLAHKSLRTTERYVRPNKRRIGEAMAIVEEKLFNSDGRFRDSKTAGERTQPTV